MPDPVTPDNPTPDADEPVRPEWLPDKFKDVDAFVNSYSEAEKRLTELSTQNKALEENYSTLAQQIDEIQAGQSQTDPSEAQAQWYQMYENDPLGTVTLLAQQIARQELQAGQADQQRQSKEQAAAQAELVAKISIDEIRSRYPDFAELQPRVFETVQNTALFHDDRIWQNPQSAVQALDDAYKLTKGADYLAGTIPAEPGYDAAAAKRAAQTATGGNPRPDTVNDQEQAWERIKAAGEASYANLRKT